MQQELEAHVQQMVNAGHMAPTLYFIGLGGNPALFYGSPQETVYALSVAYPYLSASLKTSVKAFLTSEIQNYPPHSTGFYGPNNGTVNSVPGARREFFPINSNISFNFWPGLSVHVSVAYSIWAYSYYTGDWTYATSNYNSIKSLYTALKSGGSITSYPQLAGVIGFARIAKQLNNTADYNDAVAFAETGFAAAANFSQFLTNSQTNFPPAGHQYVAPVFLSHRASNYCPAFHFNRDLGLFLRNNASVQVSSYAAQVEKDVPVWWLTQTALAFGENLYTTPDIAWTNFMIHSYVMGDDTNKLKGYLDRPDRKGDLYYIQKLVATIESSTSTATSTGTANIPPTVSLSSPTNGATFTAPASVVINATAADSDGTIAQVVFYQNGVALSTDTTSPYSFTWNNVASGTYNLTARATDNTGSVSTSTVVSITVNAAPTPPAAPSSLSATAISQSQINLAWTDNSNNETGFRIERKTGAAGTYAQINLTASNAASFNDTALSAATTYFYRIRATNGAGDSTYTSEVSARTQSASPVVNLISNGDFESGSISPWSNGSNALVVASGAHFGTRGVRMQNAGAVMLEQGWITVQPGQTYILTGWFKWDAFSGSGWGNDLFAVTDNTWTEISGLHNLHALYAAGEWHKLALTFVPTNTQVRVQLGMFGPKDVVDLSFDDMVLQRRTGANQPPVASPSADVVSGDAPLSVQFTANADDPDGAVANHSWDFGDGSLSTDVNPTHVYNQKGTYQVVLTAIDNEGLSATGSTTIQVINDNLPTVAVTGPSSADNFTTSASQIILSGTASVPAGRTVARVSWDNVNTGESDVATFTSGQSVNWSLANVKIKPGKNEILITCIDSQGYAGTDSITINRPVNGPIVSNISLSAPAVRQYEKFEVTFNLETAAEYTFFKYDTNPPPGIKPGIGVTAEAVITAPSGKILRQPAFWTQDMVRTNLGWGAHYDPTGTDHWKIRIAPQETGNYNVTIHVQDASGVTDVAAGSFVSQPPIRKGFVGVSAQDPRYFQFSNGNLFWPIGPVNTDFSQVGNSGLNFVRPWMAGRAAYSTNWARWLSAGLAMGNEGAENPLSFREHYPSHELSREIWWPEGKYIWLGFLDDNFRTQLKANTDYMIKIRVKTEGLSGPVNAGQPSGFMIKTGGWPDPGWEQRLQTRPSLIPVVNRDRVWHSVVNRYRTDSTDASNTYLFLYLDNVTSGRVNIDDFSIREILPGGAFGPELVRHSKGDMHTYVDQAPAADFDWEVSQAEQYGVYLKYVIQDKNDMIPNKLAPNGSWVDYGGGYYQPDGTKSKWLLQQWWRYLAARWGYSTAVHSWELNNEGPPDGGEGSHARQTQDLAKFMHDNDSHPHLVTTSFWCCWEPTFWGDKTNFPDVGYGDIHEYAKDPSSAQNFASWTLNLSAQVQASNVGRPVIRAETGVGDSSTAAQAEFDQLGNTNNPGIWYHDIQWLQLGPGAMFDPNYWHAAHLSHIQGGQAAVTKPFVSFTQTLDVDKGGYADAAANSTSTNLWALGQKNLAKGKAHLWIKNKNHGWYNVMNNPGAVGSVTANVTIQMSPNSDYRVQWWDTYSGIITSTQTMHSDNNGNLTLSISNLVSDLAIKMDPITDTQAPMISNGQPSGSLLAGTTWTIVSLVTDENSVCRYSMSPNTLYSNMPSPFSTTNFTYHYFTMTGLANGQSYNVYARCSDMSNNATNSDYAISFTVSSNTPPTVSAGPDLAVTLPTAAILNGSVSDDGLPNPPGKVSVTWTKVSGPGTVTFASATVKNTTATFSQAGAYLLRFTASDGSLSAFDETNVTVNTSSVPNNPPTVSISSPASGAIFTAPASITINAAATDSDGSVVQVQFYQGAALLGTDSAAPYSLTWSNVSSGSYVLTARATDDTGSVSTSTAVNITVNAFVDTSSPTAPSNLSATNLSTMAVTFSWSASSDNVAVADYRMDLSLSNSFASFVSGYQDRSLGLVTNHTASGLSADTTYYARLRARDAAGNTSPNSSTLGAKTLAVPDTTAPSISNVAASGVGSSSATVSWTTDESADTQVEYGLTASYGSSTTLNSSLLTAHSQFISGLLSTTLYHYRVRSRDMAGNLSVSGDFTFTTLAVSTSDLTLPTIAISSPANNAAVTGTITISGTAADNVSLSKVEISVDAGAYLLASGLSGWTFALNTSTLTNGSHSISARATDSSNNIRIASIAVTVNNDTTAPSISNVSASGIGSSSATVSWTTNENSDSQIDYGPTVAYGSSTVLNASLVLSHSQLLSSLALNRLYHYRVRSKDSAGNSAVSGDFTFTTLNVSSSDVTAPAVSITTPTAGATVSGAFNIVVNASDNVGISNVEIYIDGALRASGSFSYAWSTLAEANGTHSIVAKAYDAAGNTNSSTSTVTVFNTDATPPTVSITSPANGATVSGNVTVNASASDNIGVARVEFYADGQMIASDSASPYSASWNSLAVANGSHALMARAYDAAGNNTSASVNVTVNNPDITAPTIVIVTPANNSTVSGVITISGTAADNAAVAMVEVQIGSRAFAAVAGTATWTYSLNTLTLNNTVYSIVARATDLAGNRGTASISVSVNNILNGPTISNVTVGQITANSAVVSWDTDVAADSEVEFGLTSGYGETSGANSAMVLKHSVQITGLRSNSTYHLRVKSRAANGIMTSSQDSGFATPKRKLRPAANLMVAQVLSKLILTWDSSESGASFIVVRTTANYPVVGSLQNAVAVTPNRYEDDAVAPGVRYYYAVYVRSGQDEWSDPVFVSKQVDLDTVWKVVSSAEGDTVNFAGNTGVTIPGQILNQDMEISVTRLRAFATGSRLDKLRRIGRTGVGSAINFGPEGTQFKEPVTLCLSYEANEAAGVEEKTLAVAYWNEKKEEWEILDSTVDPAKRTVSAKTSHFSIYQIVGKGSSFALGKVYSFPNPAVHKTRTVIHVETDFSDQVELNIYTEAGELLHSATLTDPAIVNGALAYEYSWDLSAVPSGIYFYSVQAKKEGVSPLKTTGKIAVVK